MSFRTQAIIVIAIIISAIGLSKLVATPLIAKNSTADIRTVVQDTGTLSATQPARETKKLPERRMDVLDPKIDGESVLIQDLDLNFPYFNYQTYKQWPIASLTKLMTAIVVTEQFGLTKKIPITDTVMKTEGIAGELKSGETYTSEDLMKIMLLVSSNRAATAFEEYAGGKEVFSGILNKKAMELGMLQTTFHDGSGLSAENVSTTSDLLKLAKYLVEKHPEIIAWTRLQTMKVQPTNTSEIRSINNINPFSSQTIFLGGKTGTSPEARENLLALFSFNNNRIIYILLGSHDRVTQTEKLLKWIPEAYSINK